MGFLELRRQCGVFHEVPRGSQGASCMAPGKSSIPFECKLELGIALQSLQGKIDLIYACVQDLVFHYWADRECTRVYILRGARDTSVITAFSLVIIVGKHTKPHQFRA